MSYASELEREEELEEEYPFSLPWREAEFETPADASTTVAGFNRFSEDVARLPEAERRKLQVISQEIKQSLSGDPGAKPVTQVTLLGHADRDVARENREPGFLQFISERRALAVYFHLSCQLGERLASRIRWIRVGRGAGVLAAPNARTEAERRRNRRVEIVLGRNAELPLLDLSQNQDAGLAQERFRGFFEAALQGTSGQFDRPFIAVTKAREIAERVVRRVDQRIGGMQGCPEDFKQDIEPYLKDALSGTASKFSNPEVVINKAFEAAEHARYFATAQQMKKIQWEKATVPQPMDVDCDPQGRVPGGPANYVLCRQHGHILDVTNRKVIAKELDDYRKRFLRAGAQARSV
ncbi:MAG TPA: hypothetical protein VNX70_16875 [Bryobacteraceae bacterium]|nr:hypothetical protein [Bryobacteraceae bacterium]